MKRENLSVWKNETDTETPWHVEVGQGTLVYPTRTEADMVARALRFCEAHKQGVQA